MVKKDTTGLKSSIDALSEKVDGIRDVVEVELRAVNDHLKALNGTVATHERRLNEAAIAEAIEHGERKGAKEALAEFMKLKWTLIGTIAIGVLGILGVLFRNVISHVFGL